NNAEAPVVIRPWGVVREQLEAALESAGVRVMDEPPPGDLWGRDSIQIAPGASLTELGAFRQGLFFIQDPASTLVTQYASVPTGSVVADLCAAPGGKSVELSRVARTVISADRSESRLRRMVANRNRLEATSMQLVV